ncbi:MAG: hypothetical protein MZV63_17900 [Marinilabiliales bacterium]|nr:hypothetical protein [Marinilabiliales bacterium]
MPPYYILSIHRECIDCSMTGTAIKPDYWDAPGQKKLIILFSMKTRGTIKLVLFLAACLPAIMSGQDASTGIASVTSGLEGYRTTNPFEELWLHTDRESLCCGRGSQD